MNQELVKSDLKALSGHVIKQKTVNLEVMKREKISVIDQM